VLGPDRGAVEAEQSPALEDAVDDGVGEIVVVKDVAPSLGMLVGREDHRAAADVAVVHDVVEHVGGVIAVGEVADLVDDEHVRLHVAPEGLAEPAFSARR
jgi:hypothetical protein